MKPKPIVTVIRPVLTAEEKEAAIEEVKRRLADFWIAARKEREKCLAGNSGAVSES